MLSVHTVIIFIMTQPTVYSATTLEWTTMYAYTILYTKTMTFSQKPGQYVQNVENNYKALKVT